MSTQPDENNNPPADPPKNDPPKPVENDPPKPPENNVPDFSAVTAALSTMPEAVANSVKEVLDGWKPPVVEQPKNDPPKNDPPKDDPPKKDEPPVPGKRTFADWWFGK